MENNTQTQSPYISLEFCSCKQDFTQIPITRRDLGNTGTFINYSMVVAGTGSSELLSKYMDSQEISKRVNTLYKYKLMGNFGIFSYLFKKVEGKDNERAIKEVVFETAATEIGGTAFRKVITSQTTKTLATKTASRLGITMAGRILGGYVGSVIPIAGTIVGAIAGAWLAGKVEEWWFSEEDKQLEKDKAENERIKQREIQYQNKINRINDYLIRNHYVELRDLTEVESEMLCKESSNIYSSYFKTILLMLSFPNYLDRDTEFYKSLQSQDTQKEESKKEILIQPIANAIPLRLEIQECYDSSKGALLKNTTIYIYNHRFQRVVAKGRTDSKGSLIIDAISVGKEIGIDKISFIVDRDNLSESNFELSKTQYATITNIQTKHKQAKEYTANKIYLGFNDMQSKLKADYEVIRLHAQKGSDTITLTPQINTTDMRYKQYTQFAYMTFDVMDFSIDEYIANISIQNRQSSGLNRLGTGLKESYPIKKEWHNKIVAFFGYCDSQIHTPYVKMSFMQPIVIIDIGDSGALHPRYEQGSMKRRDIILDVVDKLKKRLEQIRAYPIILGQNNESLEQRVKIVNAIKHNIQNDRILLLSLHIDSEESGLASGMRCFYNAREYAREEEDFIARLENIKHDKNNANFAHKSNMYLAKFAAMPSVLITLGFISNDSDRAKLNDANYRNTLVSSLHLAILHHITQTMTKNPMQRAS
ncbi:N-acetylmuramoyl-L-alanine amidase [Helicobacter sp. UBA3407]|uniref:N-acetylmuramoyl-L-alanine amidase n=1 Tax=Helicobacter TaxID=209 RepID=UPI00262CC6CF|nr:N-acetylmuramoyl-L-alanine amidase [Helicobacter sp. UBA3407]